ncbi:delta(3,5)-Delta(2,4)-dienoyl-CoA isomerase, peroxisomal [Canna indica]|uniref:Delta(3,5)-Delta(2,4)-dienoyl-CoA isomerase, peroxisomal n=1 Tax=Canna indica TaxID=4628 RepID=A0AAQ3KRF7_9LILI|nr:delta(3,5)-Delta(2,4)-dienoyl-CoA isomerase, peroxisomal [Canna indica]
MRATHCRVWCLTYAAHSNALTLASFANLPCALALLDRLPFACDIVFATQGPHFCTNIDLSSLGSITTSSSVDCVASSELLRCRILALQAVVFVVERCRKPVVAAIHDACIGSRVDLDAACDIWCYDEGAFFVVKEVDLALAVDLGSLQCLLAIIGYGNTVNMALTGRRVAAAEAKSTIHDFLAITGSSSQF